MPSRVREGMNIGVEANSPTAGGTGAGDEPAGMSGAVGGAAGGDAVN